MLIEDIATILDDAGVGVLGTDMFIGSLPTTPNNAIVIVQTTGTEPDSELPLDNPTFQILIRNTTYTGGQEKLGDVKDALHQFSNQEIGDTYFYYILANTNGGSIGRDEQDREEFSINFRCSVREV